MGRRPFSSIAPSRDLKAGRSRQPATYEYLIEPGTTSPFTGEPGTVPQSGQTATIYTDGTTVICVLIR